MGAIKKIQEIQTQKAKTSFKESERQATEDVRIQKQKELLSPRIPQKEQGLLEQITPKYKPIDFEESRSIVPAMFRQPEQEPSLPIRALGTATALGKGFLDTATLGALPYAMSKLMPREEEIMQKLKEASPVASTIGELGGYVVPGTAIAKGVSRVGGAALSKIPSMIGRGAVTGAVEGAGLGAIEGGFESARTGENIPLGSLKRAGEFGAFGGLLGGGVGAVRGGISRINKGVEQGFEDVFGGMRPSVEGKGTIGALPKTLPTQIPKGEYKYKEPQAPLKTKKIQGKEYKVKNVPLQRAEENLNDAIETLQNKYKTKDIQGAISDIVNDYAPPSKRKITVDNEYMFKYLKEKENIDLPKLVRDIESVQGKRTIPTAEQAKLKRVAGIAPEKAYERTQKISEYATAPKTLREKLGIKEVPQETMTKATTSEIKPIERPLTERKLPDTSQMTRQEFDKHYGLDQKYSSKNITNLVEDTGAKVINKVGSTDIPTILNHYKSKYKLPDIKIGYNTGKNVKMGTTQVLKRDANGNPLSYKININPNLSAEGKIGALRHEIEHVIDLKSGYKPPSRPPMKLTDKKRLVQQTTREGYGAGQKGEHKMYDWFESDYIRRASVKDALKEGRAVPKEVLDEFPDLANIKPTKARSQPTESILSQEKVSSNIKSPSQEIKPLKTPRTIERLDANTPLETKFDFEQTIGRSEGTGATRERGYSANVRTDLNAQAELRNMFDESPEFYRQLTNKKTLANAERRFKQGYEGALKEFETITKFTPEDVPLAYMIANEATKRGEFATARKVITTIAEKLTESGQFSQAARIMRKSDPSAFNMYLERRIIKLNDEGRRLFGDKWKDIKLSEKMQKEIYNLEIIDEASMERLMNNAYLDIASQMPATKWEKFDSWRRMAMLLNPKTHVRNFLGNTLMMGLRKSSDTIGAGFEKAFLKEGQRTKSFNWSRDKDLVSKVEADWQVNKESLMKGGRWDIEGMSIGSADKKIFEKGFVTKQVEKVSGKVFNEGILENMNKFSKKALEAGDEIFLGRAYKDALGQYMKANKLTEITEAGRLYAQRRALEATFRANNALSRLITQGKRTKYVGPLVEAAIPFSKTPANIAKSAIEYSPANLAKSLWSGAIEKDATKAIEELSKGLVGTAITGLGFLLAVNGWARLNREKSKKAEALMRTTGEQPNSIITPYGSYTFDWAQPAAVPFAAGVSMYENFMRKTDPNKQIPILNAIIDTVAAGGDTVFNITMLRSIKDALGGAYGSPTEALMSLPIDYIEQTFPTIFGQVARSVDDKQRLTYDPNYAKSFWNKIKAKTPYLSTTLPEKVDILGREEKQMGVLGQFISPGTGKKLDESPIIKELNRLFDIKKETDFIPSLVNKTFSFDKEVQRLTGFEISEMQKEVGKLNNDKISKHINSLKYKLAKSDEDRISQIKKIVQENAMTAKKNILEKRGISTKFKKSVIPTKTLVPRKKQ